MVSTVTDHVTEIVRVMETEGGVIDFGPSAPLEAILPPMSKVRAVSDIVEL